MSIRKPSSAFVIGICAGLLLLACSPGAFFAGEAIPPTRSPAAQEAIPTPTTVHAVVGGRASGDGVAITVTGVEFSDSMEGVTPEPGITYALVHVTIENPSSAEELEVSPGDFQLKSADGTLIDFAPLDSLPDQLRDAQLAPGEKQSGTIGFPVNKDQKGWHLLYDFNEQHLDFDLGS